MPLCALILLRQDWKQVVVGLILSCALFGQVKLRYNFPTLPEEGVQGVARFSIDAVSIQASPFSKSYLYRGSITQLGKIHQNIPAAFYIPISKKRPPANTSLEIEGTLLDKGDGRYVLKPKKITPIPGTFSLAEHRFLLKQKFTAFFKQRIPKMGAASFLLSMLTGDIDDRKLSLEFSRIGLIHLLGVSGFQFILLASLLGFALRCFLSLERASICLLIFLTAYFFLLGPSPPVFRAWIASALFLIGSLFNYRSSPLNALGVALMCELMISPLNLLNIGFQLTYLCTAAILLVYPLIRNYLNLLLPKRSFAAVLEMSTVNQYGYIAASLIRETLALNLAVHLISLPALLLLFGKFPLLSLIYNLFYPFGATIAFILSVIGVFLSFIPPLGNFVLWMAGNLSEALLAWASFPPPLLDYKLQAPFMSLELCVLLLTLPAAVLWKNRQEPTLFDKALLDAR